MNVQSSTLRAAALLLAFGSALACSAILKPKDKVTRCGTADDCDPTGDERYVPLCKYDDAHADLDSTKVDKICVAADKTVRCDPMPYMSSMGGMHPFTLAVDSCGDLGCAMGNEGQLGCGTASGTCLDGSAPDSFNDISFCGGEDPATGTRIIPGFALSDDLEAQHVKDAFCKSFFCDDEYICDSGNTCVRCDPDKDYGDGGCGIVYNDGAPAPVYLLDDALKDACANENADVDEPVFGGGCGE